MPKIKRPSGGTEDIVLMSDEEIYEGLVRARRHFAADASVTRLMLTEMAFQQKYIQCSAATARQCIGRMPDEQRSALALTERTVRPPKKQRQKASWKRTSNKVEERTPEELLAALLAARDQFPDDAKVTVHDVAVRANDLQHYSINGYERYILRELGPEGRTILRLSGGRRYGPPSL